MWPIGRRRPICGKRRFSLRGKVIDQISETEGWWIFRQSLHRVRIELNAEQVKYFRKALEDPSLTERETATIPDRISVFMPRKHLKQFPIGTEVGVMLAQCGPIGRFRDSEFPFNVVDLVRTANGSVLENEIYSHEPNQSSPAGSA
ncbi:MAG: hypothetical protein QOG91_294 [Candidatus Parcubacteria bacterium]|jgi:hypothetical protein|nr:hypothetical protein [Candidatus Parcubacteria bacterium]